MRSAVVLAMSGCVTALHVTTPAAISVAALAPPFSLQAQDGHTVSLANELAHGPVAIVFYRGYW